MRATLERIIIGFVIVITMASDLLPWNAPDFELRFCSPPRRRTMLRTVRTRGCSNPRWMWI